MILTQNNEYCVVLDACVLMPMPLCDTLLRAAEEPSFFRVVWSSQIQDELRSGLQGKRFGYSKDQVERRLERMNAAFPESMVHVQQGLIDAIKGTPDQDDRHVIALAIRAQANTIVTSNLRDFPTEALAPYDILVSSPDKFLVDQFHLDPQMMLEKLNQQAAGIRRPREEILKLLHGLAPEFCDLCRNLDGLS